MESPSTVPQNFELSKTHKPSPLLFLIIILLVASVFGYFIYQAKQSGLASADIRKFQGTISNIEGDTITLNGVFVSSKVLPQNLQNQQDFSFRVDESTQFKKLEIQMPTLQSLRASGKTSGTYSIKDLPRSETSGSLSDLSAYTANKGVSVEVEFADPISNFKNSKASLIFYQILSQPNL